MPYVHPTIANPDELADLLGTAGPEGPIDHVQIERSATGGGAGFANIGSVTLVSPTLRYTYFDKDGAASDWYRWYPSNAANTFPTSPNRTYSNEVQPTTIEPGICDLGDMKQRLEIDDPDDDEMLSSIIGDVTTAIEGYCERRFIRIPQSGTQTWLFDVACTSRTLLVPQGITGLTLVEVATQTGGAFATVPTSSWFERPLAAGRPRGWPGTSIVLSDLGSYFFYQGLETVRTTMALGFPSIPDDVRAIGERAVTRRWKAKQSGQADIIGTSEFGDRFLRSLPPEDRDKLDFYRYHSVR